MIASIFPKLKFIDIKAHMLYITLNQKLDVLFFII